MEKKIIITIDGYSSCGKSTLAKELAKSLGYIFIDSGAMYRAITLYFIRQHIDPTNTEAVASALQHIDLQFVQDPSKQQSEITLNGENVEHLIRSMDVAQKVSEIATIEAVRTFAVAQQQKMGLKKGIVMDGRDIGTVVFPDAELKIFMTADKTVRAQRRLKELQLKMPTITLEEVKENLDMRDHMDTHRAISPLRQANDAIILDNSELQPQEQFQKALRWAKEKIETL